MGQEGELRPLEECSCDSINPQVAEVILDLGFEHVISVVSRSPCHITLQLVSIRDRKYDKEMATHLILSHQAPKVKGWTIKVRSFPSQARTAAVFPHPQERAIRIEGQRASQFPS